MGILNIGNASMGRFETGAAGLGWENNLWLRPRTGSGFFGRSKRRPNMATPMTITTNAEERVDRLSVLLADDYRPILDFVRHLLERKYDIVGLVRDGESLVDVANRLQPDIIVLDITMPLLTGLEAADEISKRANPPKLIFLTLLDEPGVVEKALSVGASGYVLKSELVNDLEKAIESAIDGQVFVSSHITESYH
jgi:CheY-like chemotaxis protein